MRRHYRHTWDPNADLVFAKRRKLGMDPKNPYVDRGDPVDKSMFSLARLKIWWKAGYIKLAEEFDKPQGSLTSTGRGWFNVIFPDGTSKKVRGEKKAQEALACGRA